MHHIYWLLELGLHPHTCHTYLPITQPFVTLNAHPVVEMPQFGRCGPLKHLKPWRRFGGSSLPAQIDCSFRPGNFCSGYRWLNQRRIELGEGGWSWPQITWSHLILKGLLTSVDRLKKNASQHISTVLVTKLSWGMWRQFLYRLFCGISASLGWLKTHVLPSGKLTVGPWKYLFFNGN